MGIRILIGHEQGDSGISTEQAVLFDSVTGWAFGPLFSEHEEDGTSAEDMAELFLAWLRKNQFDHPQQLTRGELENLHQQWFASVSAATARAD